MRHTKHVVGQVLGAHLITPSSGVTSYSGFPAEKKTIRPPRPEDVPVRVGLRLDKD